VKDKKFAATEVWGSQYLSKRVPLYLGSNLRKIEIEVPLWKFMNN